MFTLLLLALLVRSGPPINSPKKNLLGLLVWSRPERPDAVPVTQPTTYVKALKGTFGQLEICISLTVARCKFRTAATGANSEWLHDDNRCLIFLLSFTAVMPWCQVQPGSVSGAIWRRNLVCAWEVSHQTNGDYFIQTTQCLFAKIVYFQVQP